MTIGDRLWEISEKWLSVAKDLINILDRAVKVAEHQPPKITVETEVDMDDCDMACGICKDRKTCPNPNPDIA